MKNLFFLFLFVSVISSANEKSLYYKSHNQKGFKTTIQEIERGEDYSILEVDILQPDAQGGPFSIIAAAINIGTELEKTHFTLIKEYKEGRLYYYKLFFTSDESIDPSLIFPGEMSQEKLDTHKEVGYSSIENYRKLFTGEN